MKVFAFQMIDDRDTLEIIRAEDEEEAKRKLVKFFREEEYPGFEDFTVKGVNDVYYCLGGFQIIE